MTTTSRAGRPDAFRSPDLRSHLCSTALVVGAISLALTAAGLSAASLPAASASPAAAALSPGGASPAAASPAASAAPSPAGAAPATAAPSPTGTSPAGSAALSPTGASPTTQAALTAPGDTLAADQARAAELASDIRVQGALIEQLAEQADAATIRETEVRATLREERTRAASTAVALGAARRLLSEQALAAYTSGGRMELSPTAHSADVSDPGLVSSYGEIVAGTERDAVTSYRQLRRQQAAEQDRLAAAVGEARDAAAQLRADRAAARSAVDAEQATLAGIRGRMAVLVAAAQVAQAQATAALVQASLVRQGQLSAPAPAAVARPAPAPVATPAAPASVSLPRTVPARPVPVATTAPPVTSAPQVTTTTATTRPPPPPHGAPGAQIAIAYAEAQLGKPYQFGGSGPASFDCSGLVMQAWGAAGVSFPHLAQSQYDMTARLSIGQLQPGDLVFFGTPSDVGHVGIYLGGGNMIDAPTTGQDVSIQNIYWSDLLGGGRVLA